jgi:threonine dehydrogenase-like Zn-dependent dehydrogenase
MSIRHIDLSRNLQYICSHSPEFEMFDLVLRLIERGKFDPGLIFSHEMSFQRDFVKAYDNNYINTPTLA